MSDFAVPPAPEVEAWVHKTIGATARVRFARLRGATSSTVYAVTLDGVPRFVLRLFTDRQWVGREADLAVHEAAALRHAQRAGLAAPKLIGYAGVVECGVPAVLMTHMPGAVELRPRQHGAWLEALADTLATIHRVDAAEFGWSFSSWNPHTPTTMPVGFDDETSWAALLDLAERPPAPGRESFLHRDFHPTNILWQDGTVSGVVDWVNACRGPAGVDVAHCRLNLALMYGLASADEFLRAYAHAAGGYEHDPHWDVDDAMGWNVQDPAYYPPWRDFGLPPVSRGVLRSRLHAFLRNAVGR